jgi:hypothetical protein
VDGEQVIIGAIGDYGSAAYGGASAVAARNVADLVKSWAPDFIITLGDNNYGSGAAETIDLNIGQFYHEFIHPYVGSYGAGASSNRFFPSLGNHDYATPGATPYFEYFSLPGNERYYSYRHGPVEVFALNSDYDEPDGIEADSPQAQWLQAQLGASTATWKLVYFHTCPYSSGTYASVYVNMRWPFGLWGASAVLSGHDHLYERFLIDDLPYFVNGLGGAPPYGFRTNSPGSQVRYNASHGAMRIQATQTNITFQFINVSNVVIDTYTLGDPTGPPFIISHPQTQTVFLGADARFFVSAGGEPPLSYQWQFNGVDIPDATTGLLVVSNAQFDAEGTYSVIVSNGSGAVLSAPATLTIRRRPVILQQPRDTVAATGQRQFQRGGGGGGAVELPVARQRRRYSGSDQLYLFHPGRHERKRR